MFQRAWGMGCAPPLTQARQTRSRCSASRGVRAISRAVTRSPREFRRTARNQRLKRNATQAASVVRLVAATRTLKARQLPFELRSHVVTPICRMPVEEARAEQYRTYDGEEPRRSQRRETQPVQTAALDVMMFAARWEKGGAVAVYGNVTGNG